MNTSERIKKIGNFFQKMEITTEDDETIIYVVSSFPNGWIIDAKTEEKYNVKHAEQGGLIYFWTNISNGEDCVFDAVEYNIKQNREAQEKLKLYNETINKLRIIFEDESNTIEDLRNLVITVPKDNTPTFISNNKLTDLMVDAKDDSKFPKVMPPTIMETDSDENKKSKKK